MVSKYSNFPSASFASSAVQIKIMRKRIYIFIAILFLAAVSAQAHPLGNFSVNQYSRLEVEKSRIKIRQALDLAEIPTFQETAVIDADKNGALSEQELASYAERITPQILANLFLTINDEPLTPRADSRPEARLREGEGGLSTLQIKWDFVADLPNPNAAVNRIRFENKNYAERLGWSEIVLNPVGAVNIFDSTAFGSGVTDELESYPQETLAAPLRERSAEFSLTTGGGGSLPANAKPLANRDGHTTTAIQRDRLAELLQMKELTPAVALFGLLLAFGLGAMHAMSPGHGKTVVGAYLVGSRGTPRHAAFLGLTVTVTHTLGVFALGLITLFASNFILPERIMPFLSFVSGLLVFFIGVSLFKNRLFGALGWQTSGGGSGHHHHHVHDHSHDHAHGHHHHHGDHSHEHDGGHTHHHSHDEHGHHHHGDHHHAHDAFTHTHDGHTHSHLPPEEISWKSLLGLGISGGLLPCPSALVLMLSAISLGRVGYGLILTLVFSLGLAATLTAVGLIFLYVGRAVGNSRLAENRIVKTVPVFSAFVIACVGAVICYNSLA
jgi:nickel/cobalt transporter (NicO) family protein